MADAAVDVFGARPRDDDVEVFNAGVVFSTGVTSFDGVDARESLSLDAVSVSGFFDFDAGTVQRNGFTRNENSWIEIRGQLYPKNV